MESPQENVGTRKETSSVPVQPETEKEQEQEIEIEASPQEQPEDPEQKKIINEKLGPISQKSKKMELAKSIILIAFPVVGFAVLLYTNSLKRFH